MFTMQNAGEEDDEKSGYFINEPDGIVYQENIHHLHVLQTLTVYLH